MPDTNGNTDNVPDPSDSMFPGYHWEGQWTDLDWRQWWCPTDNEWSECPGPCPDGTEHAPTRIVTRNAKQMVPDTPIPVSSSLTTT
jgi:hypothetical protein